MSDIITFNLRSVSSGESFLHKVRLSIMLEALGTDSTNDERIIWGVSTIKLFASLDMIELRLRPSTKEENTQYTLFRSNLQKFNKNLIPQLKELITSSMHSLYLDTHVKYNANVELYFDPELLVENQFIFGRTLIELAQLRRSVDYAILKYRSISPRISLILHNAKLSCLNAVVYEIQNRLPRIEFKGILSDFCILHRTLELLYGPDSFVDISVDEFSVNNTELVFSK
jgi:hypothetical protein